MKRKLLFLLNLVALTILGTSEKALADHFAAADLYVVYIGAGIDGCTGTTDYTYEVHFDEYKPCDINPDGSGGWNRNADLSPFETVNYESQNAINAGLPLSSGSVNLANPQIDTLDLLCDKFKPINRCRVFDPNAPLGFVRHRFVGTVTLPYPQPDWTFHWVSCCTTQPLLNVPGWQWVWIECQLNNVVKYNNSTPQFLIDPLPYLCANQPAVFLNGPFDPNNDSLITQNVYHNTTSGTATLPFNPNWSLQDPVGSAASNPFRVDPATGSAYFTPNQQGRFNVTFQCTEYDRKTRVQTGYIRRDVEMNILPCAFPPPAVDPLPDQSTLTGGKLVLTRDEKGELTKNHTLVTCPGNNVNFQIKSKAQNPANKIYLSATLADVNGATFSVSGQGTDQPTGDFTWTPTNADLGAKTVIFTSKDSTCTGTGSLIVLTNYTVVLITVVDGLDAGRDRINCLLNPYPRQLSVKGFGNVALRLKWSDISGGPAILLSDDTIATPISTAPGGTTYVVSSPDLVGQCKISDTIAIITDTSNSVDIFPQSDPFVMCKPGYLQLDAIIKGAGPVDNVKNDTVDNYTCSAPDSITIWGSPDFGTGFSYDTLGTNSSVLYNDVYTSKYQFLITKDELKEYGLRAGSIKSLSFEVSKNATPTFTYGNFTIYMRWVPANVTSLSKTTGFYTNMTPVFTTSTPITLEDGWHNFVLTRPYNWDTTQNLLIGICYNNNPVLAAPCTPTSGSPGLFNYLPTSYIATLDLKAPDNITTDICSTTNSGGINERGARPIFGMTFCDMPGKPFHFTWSPSDGKGNSGGGSSNGGLLLSDSTIRQPLAYVPRTSFYSVSTLGRNGCRVADTLNVYIPVHNFSVWPADTSICYGQTVPLEVRNGHDYQWFEYEEGQYKPSFKSLSCDYCANPVAKPLKSTHYKIMVGDEVFCYDTIDAYIEVRPLPQVHILTPDTVVKYGHSVQLLVNGAKMYNWTPVSSLNNPNISYPLATPTEPTMYVVSGISSTGCYSYDTVRVGIDYRDNLNIPTAFSPNGDGKNDVFRVTNVTFQKIVEFRVFNRWGQEVYNGGGDSGAGWDGNWKGVPQEIGDYSYLVRVSSPDGLVETYKGNVTLIR